jgi:hypothetical protein
MKKLGILSAAWIVLVIPFVLTGCYVNDDPGPIQEIDKDYAILDFDRLEVGDAMIVTVEHGETFSVNIRGDRRNIDDIKVDKAGSTLRVRFVEDRNRNRQYDTYLTVTMPSLNGAVFSGAVNATVTGFDEEEEVDFNLSGASTAQFDVQAQYLQVKLSGASSLNVAGFVVDFDARVSGASKLRAYDLETENADVEASGASTIRVNASKTLSAVATGASDIFYVGDAVVNSSASGASRVSKED